MTAAPTIRNSPFAPGTLFQFAWDSTSLGLLKECPRKYYYTIILGWTSRYSSIHLTFGLGYHKALECYDHYAASIGKLNGGLTNEEHDEGIRHAILGAIRETGEYVEVEGVRTWAGWRSEDPYKNIWTLCRSVVWYLDHFRGSLLHTVLLSSGKPAVELSFYFPTLNINGIEVGLCGHFDRVVNDPQDGRESVHDRKTTKTQINNNFWQGFSPHNQFTIYTVASTVHYERPSWGITVDAAQVLVNETRFARQFIPRPPGVINEWLAESEIWVRQALTYAEANYWPMNDKSCNNYGGCAFRKVCSKSSAHRQSWLEADFIHRRWNPLETRGDI